MVAAIYPMVEFLVHRYVLHSQLFYKQPQTAAFWRRVHYDHHMNPNDLSVLFGALYTTLPLVFALTLPLGYFTLGLAGACATLAAGLIAFVLFTLGLGWSFSFVAATAQLADSTSPVERGKLLGLNDLLSGLTGAALVLIGGFALDALGVAALALGGLAIALAPAGWIVRYSLRVRGASLAPSAVD